MRMIQWCIAVQKLKEDAYRIIYTVNDLINEEIVVITAVGKRERSSVYKTAAERVEECRQLIAEEQKKILVFKNTHET